MPSEESPMSDVTARLAAIETRLDKMEARLEAFAGALALIRWASPIIVAVAAIAIGKL
jgi:hypothetical protein